MKFRIATLIFLATILSACNFTLAEDVAPPPGYIPPTPMPALVLVPPQTPNVNNGKAIFFEKCAACHGSTGLGDGEKGIQLGVTVPAFALPEIARPASPAQWYTVVTRGKIERFMPPFVSLNDQQRWDVVSYIMSLHTSDDEIQKGRKLFEANCPNCSTDFYKDQSKMSALSAIALARIVRLGNDEIQAFGENLSDDDMWAVAAYLRSLSVDKTPLTAPTVVPVTSTPVPPADTGTSSAEGTPVDTTQAEVPVETTSVILEGFGNITGSIENKTGTDLPSDLVVTLHGFEHDLQNPSAGTQEVTSMDGKVSADGTFMFENVEMPENRIFLARVIYKGIEISSDYAIAEVGQTSIDLPPLALYAINADTSTLAVDELDIFFSKTSESAYEMLALYTFRNASEAIVAVEIGDTQEIPFLKFPVGAQGLGYEAVQDSAPFISTDNGFAMAPNETPYGILAFSSIVIEKKTSISQPLPLPVTLVRVFVPDGMEADGTQLTQDSQQDIQGAQYQSYIASNLKAGDTLTFIVSGSPKAASAQPETSTPNKTLLIGAGGLGLAFILAGAWMFLRGRASANDDEEDENDDEFESTEDVMDAIIALDDLYRAKKISDDAYQHRRAELKEILKEMA